MLLSTDDGSHRAAVSDNTYATLGNKFLVLLEPDSPQATKLTLPSPPVAFNSPFTGNRSGFFTVAEETNKFRPSLISLEGRMRNVGTPLAGLPLAAASGANSHLLLWSNQTFTAYGYSNTGEPLNSGLQLPRIFPGNLQLIDVAANDDAFLAVTYNNGLHLRALSFDVKSIAAKTVQAPTPTFLSVEGGGSNWYLLHHAREAALTKSHVTLQGTNFSIASRTFSSSTSNFTAAINSLGQIIVCNLGRRGIPRIPFHFQIIETNDVISAPIFFDPPGYDFLPTVSGDHHGIALLYSKSTANGSNSLAFAALDPDFRSFDEIILTNIAPYTVYKREAAHHGAHHLFGISSPHPRKFELWLASLQFPFSQSNPLLIPFNTPLTNFHLVAGTNEFLLFVTRGPATHEAYTIGFNGSISEPISIPPFSDIAGSIGGPAFAIIEESDSLYAAEFLGDRFGPLLTLAEPAPSTIRSKPRICAAGGNFLAAWIETSSTGSFLRGARFDALTRNVSLHTLLELASTNDFTLTSSSEAFLIFCNDGARDYYVRLDILTSAIQTHFRPADPFLLEPVRPVGLRKDFLIFSARSDNGIYLSGQSLLNGDIPFELHLGPNQFIPSFLSISVTGDLQRDYGLESTRNFQEWFPIESLQPGDTKAVPRDSAEFFRLRLIPN